MKTEKQALRIGNGKKKKIEEDNSKLFQDTSSKAGKVLDKNRLYPT